MNRLEEDMKWYEQLGYPVELVDAPKDAQTFDKMLVISSREGDIRTVVQVVFYSSKENKIISRF